VGRCNCEQGRQLCPCACQTVAITTTRRGRGRANDGIETAGVYGGVERLSHGVYTHGHDLMVRPRANGKARDCSLQRVPPRLGGKGAPENEVGELGEGGELLKPNVRHVGVPAEVEPGERGQLPPCSDPHCPPCRTHAHGRGRDNDGIDSGVPICQMMMGGRGGGASIGGL
jgi:hypothetical protein